MRQVQIREPHKSVRPDFRCPTLARVFLSRAQSVIFGGLGYDGRLKRLQRSPAVPPKEPTYEHGSIFESVHLNLYCLQALCLKLNFEPCFY